MNFRASFCDPFKPDIIELGDIDKEKIMETFENIPWDDYLKRMEIAKDEDLYYSPSFEVENKDNKNGLSVSIIDDEEWYIFYNRPKVMKKLGWFRTTEYLNNDYGTHATEQSIDNVRECLKALIDNDLEFLEKEIR